ncbi:unnamed protein product [Heligmosomoides polygyrus]|uniref:MSP domain-containing protein n=1 Tax=Heligmosomoides polygyrus TaxID=6339 RepID=A0A183G7P0_HELPZ|nr:unnamed protein product [Heligmosomoides polygyrus]
MDRKMALNRRRNYLEEISTVEFAHPAIPSAPPMYDRLQIITVEETEAASMKMKTNHCGFVLTMPYPSFV